MRLQSQASSTPVHYVEAPPLAVTLLDAPNYTIVNNSVRVWLYAPSVVTVCDIQYGHRAYQHEDGGERHGHDRTQ